MVKKIIISILLVFGLGNISFASDLPERIRVAIIQDTPSITITVFGYYEIINLSTKNILVKGKNLRNVRVLVAPSGFQIGSLKLGATAVRISSKNDAAIYINNRRFRGKINIIPKDNARFMVVNELGIEDYLKGVLYHEISPRWPLEAIKAQAVVARTYAIYQAMMNKDKDFDVTSDIYSQVYGGKTSERYRTNVGVDRTKGQYLTYQGQIFPAYYHATCAGYTEDASVLWNINLPPLKGVECGYCFNSPHIRWEVELSFAKIRDKLNDSGYSIDSIQDIKIAERNSSGRISKIKINSGNKVSIILGKDFRQALGPNVIRSTNFNIRVVNGYVYFYGLGWGHGVGLCQWGTYFMAEKGFKYDKIIEHYYPGAIIKK